MDQIQQIVDSHALKIFYSVNYIKQTSRKITLRLRARNESLHSLQGTLGCIVDCAARLAGFTAIGNCYISESETTSHSTNYASELVVRVHIDSKNVPYATYHCEIHNAGRHSNTFLAESQGTIVARGSVVALAVKNAG